MPISRHSIKCSFISLGLASRSPQGVSSTHYPKMGSSNSWGGAGLGLCSGGGGSTGELVCLYRVSPQLCARTLFYFGLWQNNKGCFCAAFSHMYYYSLPNNFQCPFCLAFMLMQNVVTQNIVHNILRKYRLIFDTCCRHPVILAAFHQPFEIFPCATRTGRKHPHENERNIHRKKKEGGSTSLLSTWRQTILPEHSPPCSVLEG